MRFNSVIGAFFFVIFASTFAMVIFIQTNSFGNLFSKVISDISQKKTNTKVTVKNVKISMFPPGLVINHASFTKVFDEGKKLQAELGEVGLYFNLIEIEDRNLAFGEIKLSEAVIEYEDKKERNTDIKKIEPETIKMVFNFFDDLPLRIDTLLIENTKVNTGHDVVDIRRLKLFKDDNHFTARFHLANLNPFPNNSFFLDEVWGDADIGKKNINIQRLKIQHDVHTLLLKGKIQDYPSLKTAQVNVNGESLLFLKSIKQLEGAPDWLEISSGSAFVNFKFLMTDKGVDAEVRLSVDDLKSNLAYADKVLANLSIQRGKLLLSEFELRFKNQFAKLLTPAIVANLEKDSLFPEPLKVQTSNLSINNVIRFLGPSFNVLKGSLSGNVLFDYKNDNFYFRPADGFKIRNLGLVVGEEKPFHVLMVKEAILSKAEFAIISKEFQMSSIVKLDRSQLEVDGFVNKREARFSVDDAKVNLSDFGNIANIDLVGNGELDIEVVGPLRDTEIKLKGQMQNLGVLGYQLGSSDIDLGISLKDSAVTIKKLESIYGKTPISGSGVVNYSNLDIALGINSPSGHYSDLKEILKPIFSKLDFLPADLDFKSRIDAYVFGKTRLNDLRVKSDVKFSDLTAYGESLNQGSLTVELSKQVLKIKDIATSKGRGTLNGHFTYGLESQKLGVNLDWDNFALSSFNFIRFLKLNLNADMSGELVGGGTLNDYTLNLENRLNDTRSQNYQFKDSQLNLKILPQRYIGDVHLFGNLFVTDFDYSTNPDLRSSIKVDFKVDNFKPLAVALFGQHLEAESFQGKLKFKGHSIFNHGFTNFNLSASVDEASFNHESFKVEYVSEAPEFLIENNKIKRWNLNIRQPDLFLVTNGDGIFGKEVSLIHELHLNTKILEILFAPILSSEGFARNIIRLDGEGNNYDFNVSSRAEDLSFSVEGAPFPINNLKYSIDYADNRLNIREFITSLESGKIFLKGDVFFDGEDPDVNLKYQLDRAQIPILGKSIVIITGEGIILGNNPPYTLGGELVLNKTLIVNEWNEFNNKSSSIGQVRFLPKNQVSPLAKLLNLNLNIKAENPIQISNSMMDVALKGELRLNGSPIRPNAEGRLFSPVNSSRIFFKNNEYFITSADINFSPKKDVSNPDFDVQALTNISSYRVLAKAYGDLERFNFDLTSEPALPRNSILSLIAFGYTDEIQSTLTQGEQQNLTQVGVGSFVFDRFKISDILNKQFGLQVNLGTVFEQSQTESMLAGRSQEGQGTIGRTRSATKIELKKRLDEALTLSVSSTMGGSIGQRQSMNLTYSVNKKVQLEGVYELRTNAEGEEDIIDNSIGGDLKFRWTFK
jgi:translocation and assembly module TamB